MTNKQMQWLKRLQHAGMAWGRSVRTTLVNRLAVGGHRAVVLALVRRHWVVGVGLLTAVLAFWFTQQYAEQQVEQERLRMLPKGGMMEVLVASRDLAAGDVASPATIAVRRVPKEWVLPETLGPLDFDSVHQRPMAQSLRAGHPLTVTHLQKSAGPLSGLVLGSGYRAISIPVDEVTSVGGLIQPGDRIDLWAAPLPSTPADTSSFTTVPLERSARGARLVAENLRVIATGMRTERAAANGASNAAGAMQGYGSVTVAVPASVAATVLGGQFQGRISLALRAPEEPVAVSRSGSRPGPTLSAAPVEILLGGIEGGLQ